jgi:hypothetical protein
MVVDLTKICSLYWCNLFVVRKTTNQGPQYYMDTLLRLRENVRRKRPEEWDLGVSDFFPDGVSVHSAISLREFLSKSEMIVVPPTPSHTTCNI